MYRVKVYETSLSMDINLQKKYWFTWITIEGQKGTYKEGLRSTVNEWVEEFKCKVYHYKHGKLLDNQWNSP